MVLLFDIALAATIIVFLPVRGWFRYRRRASPSRTPIYLIETALLTGALICLLYRHGVAPQGIGIQPVLTIKFITDLIVCVTVVIGLDVVSLKIAVRQVERQQSTLRLATPETLGIVTEALDSGRHLRSFIPTIVVGAAWEELCFRGTFFLLIPRTSMTLLVGAVLGGSLLFGSQHLRNGPTAVMYSTFYGLLFSCLYLATNDLIAVVIAHAAGNLFAATYGAPTIARIRDEAVLKTSIFVG
jgi:membrane protease YdiL (CAAX protease family)